MRSSSVRLARRRFVGGGGVGLGSLQVSLCASQCLRVNSPLCSSRKETLVLQVSHMTRPLSYSEGWRGLSPRYFLSSMTGGLLSGPGTEAARGRFPSVGGGESERLIVGGDVETGGVTTAGRGGGEGARGLLGAPQSLGATAAAGEGDVERECTAAGDDMQRNNGHGGWQG